MAYFIVQLCKEEKETVYKLSKSLDKRLAKIYQGHKFPP